jgi:hypothetical protein
MDVRKITYQDAGIHKSKSNKWNNLDDSIFNTLAELVDGVEQEKISDLLNIFYYFIICYSKMCFRKDANWDNEYKLFTHYKNKKKCTMGNTFDYDLANTLNSHSILLNIQKKLYSYRKQFFQIKSSDSLNGVRPDIRTQYVITKFFTDEKKQEILDFINESLYDITKFITPPVKLISSDINAKINKYKNIKSKTRVNLNPKYNEQTLKAILGYDVKSDYAMTEITFKGGNAPSI